MDVPLLIDDASWIRVAIFLFWTIGLGVMYLLHVPRIHGLILCHVRKAKVPISFNYECLFGNFIFKIK